MSSKSTTLIPLDRLAFYSSAVRAKDGSNNEVVGMMPFDLKEIEGVDNDGKWKILQLLAFQHLLETGKLPSYAKAQDYERAGSASYQTYRDLEQKAIELSTSKEPAPITQVFHNAFDTIVLPAGFKERIIETVSQLKDHKKIFDEWGLGEKVKRGRGINILFSGQSGTGKTYCGEVIAEYLGTKANLISVASLESKFVGESEQNVSSLFASLNGGNQVLILDEVDSFLSSRSMNDGSNGQYQNKLTNQFLIELERHNGIVIMTTNRPVKLDKALQRRIDLILDFPAPDVAAREQIWKYMIPKKMPTKDVDHKILATIELNGGQIKNAVLATARKAISRDVKDITTDLFKESALEEQKESRAVIDGKDHA